MTTKKELYKLIDELNQLQLENAKLAITSIILGSSISKVPICDLGTPEDITTLYETVVYDEKNKM